MASILLDKHDVDAQLMQKRRFPMVFTYGGLIRYSAQAFSNVFFRQSKECILEQLINIAVNTQH